MAAALDEAVRARALARLSGPFADPLAHEVVRRAALSVEDGALAWEGSHGTVLGHTVTAHVPKELYDALVSGHATMDALTAALSAAVAEDNGHALAELKVVRGDAWPDRDPLLPYRSFGR